MGQHMLTPPDIAFTDKRKSSTGGSVADEQSHLKSGNTIFTANASGSTTTLVGATADDGTNAVRVGDKGYVFDSSDDLKEETLVTVTAVATSTSDTVTFSPALSSATASGDYLALPAVLGDYADNDSLDARLNTINSTLYSQTNLDSMTQNDKVYAIRLNDDPDSF